jgi:hypothetical protein
MAKDGMSCKIKCIPNCQNGMTIGTFDESAINLPTPNKSWDEKMMFEKEFLMTNNLSP